MKHHGPVYVICYTIGVALLFALGLSAFSQATARKIEANEQAKIKRQILVAFGYEIDEGATSEEILEYFTGWIG